jgi:putative Holliday junction resolvase
MTERSSDDPGNTEDSAPESSETFPSTGCLLGLDYGTKRVGIAICDYEQRIAGPLDNYSRINSAADAAHLKTIASEYRATGLVVGLPVHMSGDEGEKAKEARRFAEWASAVTGLPVKFQDERFTTARADDAMRAAGLSAKKRKQRIDKVAAQMLLQAFLDRDERESAPRAI